MTRSHEEAIAYLRQCLHLARRRGRPHITQPDAGRLWSGTVGRWGPVITGEREGPYAERIALDQAGPQARGATLYVNLEPCNHTGRTPPCTEAILESGIKRVVFGMEDPNPRVSGGGGSFSGPGG